MSVFMTKTITTKEMYEGIEFWMVPSEFFLLALIKNNFYMRVYNTDVILFGHNHSKYTTEQKILAHKTFMKKITHSNCY